MWNIYFAGVKARMWLYCFIVVTILNSYPAGALDLCTCNQLTCDMPVNCTHGLVLDQCGCCMVCARGIREVCGGGPDGPGVCATGLQCVIHAQPGDLVTGKELGTCEGNIPTNSYKIF